MYPRNHSILLVCFDLLALAVVWWTQWVFSHGNWQGYIVILCILFSILNIGFLNALDTYHLGRDRGRLKLFFLVLLAMGGFHITLPFLFRVFDITFSLAGITLSFVINSISLFVIRVLSFWLAGYFSQEVPFLFIGENLDLNKIEEICKERTEYRFIGYIAENENASEAQNSYSYFGNIDSIQTIVRRNKVAVICVGHGNNVLKSLSDHLIHIKELGIEVTTFSQFYQSIKGYVSLEDIDSNWLLGKFNLSDMPINIQVKRLCDIFFALIGFLLLVPLAIVIWGINLFLNPGPLLYLQNRVGQYGREFRLYKFRSMLVGAEQLGGAQWAKVGDDRATAWGQFMRRTHLDETPQLWNVLKGDMSLVGPRPERLEIIQKIENEINHYRLRHLVKPGITGWAQMNIQYADSVVKTKWKLQYDLFYIKHFSIFFDFIIIAKTIRTILFFRGR